MAVVTVRTGKLNYEEMGSGQPLVLLHANPGEYHDYDSIMPELARHFRVLAVDWPGYGGSDAPLPPASASAMLFAEVLEDFVSALDLPPAIFVGNSVGGYAATCLALKQPERVAGLVLIAPGGFTPQNWFTRTFCWIKGREWVTYLAAGIFASLYLKRRNLYVRQILDRTIANRHLPERVTVDAAIWRSFTDPEHDLRGKVEGLNCPILLIFGRYDPVIPANKDGQAAAKAMPQAQFVVLPTGHMPFAEDTELFMQTIRPFLEEVSHRYSPSYS